MQSSPRPCSLLLVPAMHPLAPHRSSQWQYIERSAVQAVQEAVQEAVQDGMKFDVRANLYTLLAISGASGTFTDFHNAVSINISGQNTLRCTVSGYQVTFL